jgi:PQ loop repeat
VLQGYGVLVGSCFRSTPQIARIVRAGSARGVSLTASIAELIAYSITCAYNMRLGASWACLLPTSTGIDCALANVA